MASTGGSNPPDLGSIPKYLCQEKKILIDFFKKICYNIYVRLIRNESFKRT